MTIGKESWENDIKGEGTLEILYSAGLDLQGLLHSLATKSVLENVEKRLKLDPQVLSTKESHNELIDETLKAIDITSEEELEKDLDETLENLQLAKRLQALNLNLSLSEGDPNKPASFQGDTTAYLSGGCSLVREPTGRNNPVLLLFLFIPFLWGAVRRYG